MQSASEQVKAKWCSIDTAPKDGTSVLVVHASTAENSTYGLDGYRTVLQANYEDGTWVSLDCARLESEKWRVTHWMPLPALPDTAPSPAPMVEQAGERVTTNERAKRCVSQMLESL
jgi:hypothetical protein